MTTSTDYPTKFEHICYDAAQKAYYNKNTDIFLDKSEYRPLGLKHPETLDDYDLEHGTFYTFKYIEDIKNTLIPKPSMLIRAMIKGLREEPNDHFEVDMTTFGYVHRDVCYGCAATATILNLTDISVASNSTIRDRDFTILNYSIYPSSPYAAECQNMHEQVYELETTIDTVRQGTHRDNRPAEALRGYYGYKVPPPKDGLPYLESRNYKEFLPAYEAYAEQLEKEGY